VSRPLPASVRPKRVGRSRACGTRNRSARAGGRARRRTRLEVSGRRQGRLRRWIRGLRRRCWVGLGHGGRLGGRGRSRRRNRHLLRSHGDGRWRRQRRRRRSHHSLGQQRQRIDVALFVGCHANAEMDVRRVELRRAARPDRPDRRRLVDSCAGAQRQRTEVCERDGVPVAHPDAEGQPISGRRSRERDDSSGRRDNRAAGGPADVDATALAGGIRMRAVERERPQDRPSGRPRPCRGTTWHRKDKHEHADRAKPRRSRPRCQQSKQKAYGNAAADGCQL
jgi:hypothetical protein